MDIKLVRQMLLEGVLPADLDRLINGPKREGKLPGDPSEVKEPEKEIQLLAEKDKDPFTAPTPEDLNAREETFQKTPEGMDEKFLALGSSLAGVIHDWIDENREAVEHLDYGQMTNLLAYAAEFAVTHHDLWERKLGDGKGPINEAK
jgi:hypothetical protein